MDGKKRLEDVREEKESEEKKYREPTVVSVCHLLNLNSNSGGRQELCRTQQCRRKTLPRGRPLSHPALSSYVFTVPFGIQKEQKCCQPRGQRTKNKGKCHTLGALILRKRSFVNYLGCMMTTEQSQTNSSHLPTVALTKRCFQT